MNKSNKNSSWDLTPLFSDDNDKEIEKEQKLIKKSVMKFYNKWKDRDDYLTNAKVLKEALDDFEELTRNYGVSGKQGYYFSLRRAQNQNDPTLKAKAKKVEEFSKQMKSHIRFFLLNLTKVTRKNQTLFLNNDLLSPYKNYLRKKFKRAKYTLSEPEEKILSLKSGPSHSNWVSMRSDFLSREERKVVTREGKKETKSFSDILSLMSDTNKEVRDKAAEAFNNILHDNLDVAEMELNSVLENKKINDELRGFERPDINRFIGDDMDVEVVDSLVDAVSDEFNVSREYYKFKSDLFGFKKLQYHERNVPYAPTEDVQYTFEDSYGLIKKTLSNLDSDFTDILDMFVNDGHIDVYPKKGKRGGAFCAYGLITHPVYILLNHTDKLVDVMTFAHEVGHGINDEFMRKSQNALNFGTPTSTAEVASTFFEDFVLEEILKDADDELRLSVIMQKLNGDVSTIYRQIAATNFERELHQTFREKGYLSKDEIGRLFQKHMKSYMGDYVVQSEGSENWWVYWPHLRNFFYNYSYASGLLISKALQRKVKEDSDFIKEVKRFLSAGSSSPPKQIFKELGIDVADSSFWKVGIQETQDMLSEAQSIARKLGKVE